jgi:alpha-tubulin suppressor-like RCC1 family protein
MIQNDGSLWSTGVNTYGQLGDLTTTIRSSPVQVLPTTKTNWVAVDGGLNFSIGLDSSGSIWTWGFAGNGELGDGTIGNKSSPVQVGTLTNWSKISAGNGGWHAIKTNGTLWSCGFGAFGTLGDGTTTAKSSPVQIGAATNWQNVAGGGYYGLAIRGTAGTGSLWAWGYNAEGQLGDGTLTTRSSPVQIGTLTNWKEISAGHDSGAGSTATSMATKADGTLWAWGRNNDGLLGDETVISKSSPVQVGTLTTWVSASVGMRVVTAMETTSSLTGSLYTWGATLPALGRLGPAGTSVRSPIQLGTFSSSDYQWSKTAVASGFDFTIALKTSDSNTGSLFAWGQNASGQLGDGTVVAKSSPIQVGALTTWVSASAGSDHAGAIRQY